MDEHDIQVKDLVQAVRAQLEQLDEERIAADSAPLFELQSLELELHFAVTRERKEQGKVDLKVISVGGDRGYRAEEVHKVKVTFAAARSSTGRSVVGSRAHSQTSVDGVEDVTPLGE